MGISTLPVALQGPANDLPALIQSQRTRPGFVRPLYHLSVPVSRSRPPQQLSLTRSGAGVATVRTRCPLPREDRDLQADCSSNKFRRAHGWGDR